MSTKLFFVSATSNEGEDLSLFVRAYSPEQAYLIWVDYGSKKEWFRLSPPDPSIYPIPIHEGLPGPIPWHNKHGMNPVSI